MYPTWSNSPRLIGDLNTPHGDNSQFFSPTTGFPAITVPMGYTTGTLPAGITFFGRAWDEATLIALAYSYEQATHHRRPPATSGRTRGSGLGRSGLGSGSKVAMCRRGVPVGRLREGGPRAGVQKADAEQPRADADREPRRDHQHQQRPDDLPPRRANSGVHARAHDHNRGRGEAAAR